MNFGLKGHFNIVKKKSDGTVIETYDFENLILNNGLDYFGMYGFDVTTFCCVGTGNSEPTANQVNLDNKLAIASAHVQRNETWSLDTDEKSYSYTTRYTLAVGVGTGNISEIGVFCDYSKQHELFCRALIKDNQGRPTTITKLNDEILDIFYTLKIVINTQDVHRIVNINGDEYECVLRPANFGVRNQSGIASIDGLVGVLEHPTYFYVFESIYPAYQMGSGERLAHINLGIEVANHEQGIRLLMFADFLKFRWQCQFKRKSDGQSIKKTNKQSLNVTFKVSWGRA